ncbi:MAG: hypothetical protein RLZ95_1278 [Bacteroidota bacterium]|jgi:hypothetical protein
MNKKTTLLILFALVATISLNAQRIFATKTGQILFNASGGAEKIAAANNQVDAKFGEATGQIVFAVLIKGFKFENQLMEDHFNENYMESSKLPKADFKGYIKNIKEIDFSKNGKYPANFEGDLTIHGVTNKVSTKGQIEVVQGKPTIVGDFSIKLANYGIKGAYIGDKIAGDVKIKVNCKFQN